MAWFSKPKTRHGAGVASPAAGADWYHPDRPDVRLLEHGGVTLYHKAAVLAQDTAALASLGYTVVTIDLAAVAALADAISASCRAFALPMQGAGSYAAWVDALGEIALAPGKGQAIVVRRIDRLARGDVRGGQMFVESLEYASRRALLRGARIIALVQSDDARLRFERVGGVPVNWNAREWKDSDRGLGPAS